MVERIGSGDRRRRRAICRDGGAGPGAWAQLPAPIRQAFIENASTFLDEARDPEQVIAKLRAAVPLVDVVTFAGAGHAPHVTHADVYIEALTAFIRRSTA